MMSPAVARARWLVAMAVIVCLAGCLFWAPRVQAGVSADACPVFQLPVAQTDVPSLPQLCFLQDEDGSLGPEDLLDGQRPMARLDADQLVFRHTRSSYWIYIPIRNPEQRWRTWYLQIDYPLLDEVDTWTYDLGTRSDAVPDTPVLLRMARMGDARPFDMRPVRHRLFLLPLTFKPGHTQAVVMRVRSSGALNIPLSLHSSAAAVGWAQDDGLAHGLFLGTLAMLALFNAVLYVRLRIRQSLYNAAYIICAALFLASVSGLTFQYLWPAWPWLANRAVPLTETLAILSVLAFSWHFLGIGPERWPRQAWLIRILAGLGAVLCLASLFAPYTIMIRLDTAYALVCMIVMFGLGLHHMWRGERVARWYVLSWWAFFAGYLAYGLAAFGLLPGFMARESWMQLALGSQIFLLTYAEVMQLHGLMLRAMEIEAGARRSLQTEVQSRTADLRATMRALEQANQQLRDLSLQDPLTSLLNRRGLDEALKRFFELEGQMPRGALIIFDLDHFKQVNDRHGHDVGDAALRWVAGVLLNLLRRRSDVLARFGGEEFVALLPGTSLEDAAILARAVLDHVRRETVDLGNGTVLRLTLSAGLAESRPEDTPATLLRRADGRLYRAKAAGRDQLMADDGEP